MITVHCVTVSSTVTSKYGGTKFVIFFQFYALYLRDFRSSGSHSHNYLAHNTAACHQGATNMLSLHFWGVLMALRVNVRLFHIGMSKKDETCFMLKLSQKVYSFQNPQKRLILFRVTVPSGGIWINIMWIQHSNITSCLNIVQQRLTTKTTTHTEPSYN